MPSLSWGFFPPNSKQYLFLKFNPTLLGWWRDITGFVEHSMFTVHPQAFQWCPGQRILTAISKSFRLCMLKCCNSLVIWCFLWIIVLWKTSLFSASVDCQRPPPPQNISTFNSSLDVHFIKCCPCFFFLQTSSTLFITIQRLSQTLSAHSTWNPNDSYHFLLMTFMLFVQWCCTVECCTSTAVSNKPSWSSFEDKYVFLFFLLCFSAWTTCSFIWDFSWSF